MVFKRLNRKAINLSKIALSIALLTISTHGHASTEFQELSGIFGAGSYTLSTNSAEVFRDRIATSVNLPTMAIGLNGTNSRNFNLYSITPPSVSMGCGGIRLGLGGFSFINGEELENMVNAIIQGLPNALIEIGIAEFCPQCAEAMQSLRKLAAMAASVSMDSCNTSRAIAKDIITMMKDSKGDACKNHKAGSGDSTDVYAAGMNYLCKSSNTNDPPAKSNASNKPSTSSRPVNLTWEALKASGIITKKAIDDMNISSGYARYAAATSGAAKQQTTMAFLMMSLLGAQINGDKATGGPEYRCRATEGGGDIKSPSGLSGTSTLSPSQFVGMLMCGSHPAASFEVAKSDIVSTGAHIAANAETLLLGGAANLKSHFCGKYLPDPANTANNKGLTLITCGNAVAQTKTTDNGDYVDIDSVGNALSYCLCPKKGSITSNTANTMLLTMEGDSSNTMTLPGIKGVYWDVLGTLLTVSELISDRKDFSSLSNSTILKDRYKSIVSISPFPIHRLINASAIYPETVKMKIISNAYVISLSIVKELVDRMFAKTASLAATTDNSTSFTGDVRSVDITLISGDVQKELATIAVRMMDYKGQIEAESLKSWEMYSNQSAAVTSDIENLERSVGRAMARRVGMRLRNNAK